MYVQAGLAAYGAFAVMAVCTIFVAIGVARGKGYQLPLALVILCMAVVGMSAMVYSASAPEPVLQEKEATEPTPELTLEPTPAPEPTEEIEIIDRHTTEADADPERTVRPVITVEADWRQGGYLIINTETGKYHSDPNCMSLRNSDDSTYIKATDNTARELLEAGYSPCGICCK